MTILNEVPARMGVCFLVQRPAASTYLTSVKCRHFTFHLCSTRQCDLMKPVICGRAVNKDVRNV